MVARVRGEGVLPPAEAETAADGLGAEGRGQ
jgi:hypothetical protein